MLVRKHALSELQLLIATIAALYHMVEKLTILIKRGDFNPKPRTFLHSRKVQTARTRLRAPVEMSGKYRPPAWRALLRLFTQEPGGQHA